MKELLIRVKEFRDARDWKQFHNPKDLAQAISIESAELLEHFLWKSQMDSFKVVQISKEEVADELADIFAYLLSFADVAEIDLEEALIKKLEKNAMKYPVELAKGRADKYTKLSSNN